MFKRKSLVLSRLNGLWCLLSAWQLYFFSRRGRALILSPRRWGSGGLAHGVLPSEQNAPDVQGKPPSPAFSGWRSFKEAEELFKRL